MTVINEVVAFTLTYTNGIIDWSYNELNELNQIILRRLGDRGLVYKSVNWIRLYRSRKQSSIGLISLLKANRRKVAELHTTLIAKFFIKHSTILEGFELQKTPLYKRVIKTKDQICEEANYAEPILISSLADFEKREGTNWLHDKKLLCVYTNNFESEIVDQETSSSRIGKLNSSPNSWESDGTSGPRSVSEPLPLY